MKIQRILANGALTLLLFAGVISMAGCKKQPKCGCDGDALDTLKQAHVYISYNAETKSAQFRPLWSNYDIYYFCNPSAFMEKLKTFEQGAEILVSGEYFYECNYLMNAGNGGSYSMYRIYQIQVTDVAAYDYGK
ncbi:MAG TPA: hypothetical protein VFB86_05725 [Bacteroidales bacterium]|jgi:hypothetical protein|nr:hypothetical protein [Bacteroidales bacterium]